MKLHIFLVGLLLAPVLFAGDEKAVELRGKIIHVTDGDTVGLLVGKETIKIRLEGIDAPEARQAFGTKSKEALSKLVHGKEVVVTKTGEDRYKRTLGIISLGEMNVNEKLVAEGWAWHFKKYNDDEDLAKLEVKAREAKVGLWADPKPLAPWEYRARQTKAKDLDHASPADVAKTDTPTKKFWLNTSSNVRHNESCEHFNNTKKGRLCTSTDGKACGKCGG